MDILLAFLGLCCMIGGLIGAFLPVIPGPPLAWLGLLFLNFTAVPISAAFLWTTLGVALLVTVLDYVVPPLWTKKYGGSKKGVWGSTLGLLIGIFLGPVGIIAGPFVGAYLGELWNNPKDRSKAFFAAFGSFLGFLLSTGIKFVVCLSFFFYFIRDVYRFREVFWNF